MRSDDREWKEARDGANGFKPYWVRPLVSGGLHVEAHPVEEDRFWWSVDYPVRREGIEDDLEEAQAAADQAARELLAGDVAALGGRIIWAHELPPGSDPDWACLTCGEIGGNDGCYDCRRPTPPVPDPDTVRLVGEFAQLMIYELMANIRKGDWRFAEFEGLTGPEGELIKHVQKLEWAAERGLIRQTREHAGDVANIAMMIWRAVRRLP